MAKMRTQEDLMDVKAQKPTVPTSHPFVNRANHELLLEYCKRRITFGVDAQGPLQDRYTIIDQDMAGFLQLDQADLKRRRDNRKGKDPKPTKVKPQLVLTQLMRGVTYLCSVFTPETGVFQALATSDDQTMANAFVEVMNQQAQKYQYFRQQCIFFLNMLKYNLGGIKVEWAETFGMELTTDPSGLNPQIREKMLYDGNKMDAVDMYNTFWDPSVHPVDVHKDAEFAGFIEMKTPFQIKRMIQDAELFNTDELMKTTNYNPMWYQSIPQVRFGSSDSGSRPDGKHNWAFILSAGQTSGFNDMGGYELATLYIRLLPNDFGLVAAKDAKTHNKLEIWRICILNQTKIVSAEYMNNIHDMIPIFFGCPIEDGLGLQSKSIGENLVPFQDFGAFLLNTHIDASRKNIWDLIIYDPTMVDLAAVGTEVAAKVPMAPTGYGKDIRTGVFHVNSNLDTEHTLEQFSKILEFMEYMFPTKMQQMVADIQRATTNQVAATVQATSRESWRSARLIDDQAMNPARFVMHSNMLQYQTELTIRLPNKQVVKVDASKFRGAKLEFRMGEGLRDIDKMSKQQFIKDLIAMILQGQAMSEFDVPAIINFLSTYMGVEVDLTTFRRAAPTATPPGTLAPQAGAEPIAPGGAGAGGPGNPAGNPSGGV